MEGKFIAYYRVSTQKQDLGLDGQRAAVMAYLNGGSWNLVAEFEEKETGTNKRERPELQRALAMCKKHKATLVIAKLDRLARNVHFISGLMESKVPFVAVDRPNAKPFELHIYSAMGEEEARQIAARTKAGLGVIKERLARDGTYTTRHGKEITKLGNTTNLDEARISAHAARRQQGDQTAALLMPHIDAVIASGATSLREIAAELNRRGIKTARGQEWQATSVKRILDRTA